MKIKVELIIIGFMIILIGLFSCSSSNRSVKRSNPEKEHEQFEYWKEEYKIVTFQRCLFLGYNKSTEIRNLLSLDRSIHQNFPFGIEQYRFIDSIVMPIVEKAKRDSIRFYDLHLRGMNEIEKNELNGIPIIKCCLEFYKSNELKTIAIKKVTEMKWLWNLR